jgi:hypothetical protein
VDGEKIAIDIEAGDLLSARHLHMRSVQSSEPETTCRSSAVGDPQWKPSLQGARSWTPARETPKRHFGAWTVTYSELL